VLTDYIGTLAPRKLTALDEDGRAAVRADHVGFVFQSFHRISELIWIKR
jgi:putative ABC transport system ATP-binding protein